MASGNGKTIVACALLACATTAHAQYGVERLQNGDFEWGVLQIPNPVPGQPPLGWSTTSAATATVLQYVPLGNMSADVANHIGGGYFYAKDVGSNARIRQTVAFTGTLLSDVATGNVRAVVSAYMGGVGGDSDNAQVNVIFFLANGAQFAPSTLGPVTREMRNSESVLMRRERIVSVPPTAVSMAVEVAFNYSTCCAADGVVDNVSAILSLNQPPPPAPAHLLDVELLENPGFESGWAPTSPLTLNSLNGWIGTTPASVVVESYNGTRTPNAAVQAHIAGGAVLARDSGANARLTQTIDVSGNAAAIDAGALSVRLGGYLGGLGGDADRAQLNVQCLAANGLALSTTTVGPVTAEERNFENVVVRRSSTRQIPSGTRRLVAELQFTYSACCDVNGLADKLSLMLTTTTAVAPQPLGTELLVNGSFESGWSGSSPLTLNDTAGWIGTVNEVRAESYGGANVPPASVVAALGAGPTLARDFGGNGILRQYFDLTGNAAAVDASQMAVRLSGLFGGVGSDADSAQLTARFYDAANVQLAAPSIAPVTRDNRNNESVLMRRTRVVAIPPFARTMRIDAQFNYVACCVSNGVADDLSVVLEPAAPPVPAPIGSELLVNGDFEQGWIGGSPLTPNNPAGWTGTNPNGCYTATYGPSGPPVAVATAISGGSYFLRDFSGAQPQQQISLVGNAAQVDLGALSLHLSGYFGGFGTDPDSAQADTTFLAANGAVLGLQTIGPVTAANRGNVTTLLNRSSPANGWPVPVGTRSIQIRIVFNYQTCCDGAGIADNLSAMLTSSFAGPYQWPGTGEDLLFATGVNAPPTGGPGNDVKGATGGDTAFVLVDSPNGSFDYSPLIVAANVRATGTPLLGIGFGIQLNDLNPAAPFFILYDGAAAPGAFGSPAVLPGGMNFTFFVPPGLAGTTVRLQAMAFPGLAVAAFMPALPANGIFATTEAHEIVVL